MKISKSMSVKTIFTSFILSSILLISSACGTPVEVEPLSSSNIQQPLVSADDAEENEFPWMASLKNKDGDHFCGGSLIHPDWILTAAHCIYYEAPNNIEVRIGSSNRLDQPPDIIIRDIASNGIYIHPDYVYANSDSTPDVGLLRLKNPINTITPICLYFHLPQQIELPPLNGWSALVMGWGRTVPFESEYNPDPNNPNLQKLYVDIKPDEYCRGNIDHHLCAGRRGYEYSWLCYGDSGSPMIAFMPDYLFDWCRNTDYLEDWMLGFPSFQVGIASTLGWVDDEDPDVRDCSAPYGEYTNLTDPVVAEWVQDTATGLTPCTCRADDCLGFPSYASPACLNSPSQCEWTGNSVNPDTLTCVADFKADGTEAPVDERHLDQDLPWNPNPVAGAICFEGRSVDRCGYWEQRQGCELKQEIPRLECNEEPIGIDLEAEEERRMCEESHDYYKDCDEIDPFIYSESDCQIVTYAACGQTRELHEWPIPGLDRTGCVRDEGDTISMPCTCPGAIQSEYGGNVLEPASDQ